MCGKKTGRGSTENICWWNEEVKEVISSKVHTMRRVGIILR